MRTQSEIIKPLTPLRRIPKNRGTVVKNLSDINPLSEKEIKNVIEVYSEANKAYFKNHIKNEKNKNKKKKKKIISKKTESEEFNPLSLNPLEYRNKKFEENGTLLHLPGSNINPKYIPHNPNTEYGVSSLSYATLHKSNPLLWGFDYKRHYELPTICSIVKSKHPIYSKPNDRKKKQKYSNLSKSKAKKKKNKASEKYDENLVIKKVPTFGNYKEYEISDHLEGTDKKNKKLNEFIKNTESTINGNLDEFKGHLNNSIHCSESNENLNNTINNDKLANRTKHIIEKNNDNYNISLKKQDNEIGNKNEIIKNDEKKEDIINQINELNIVYPKNENSINIYSNISPNRTLSNSTLMEFKFLNIELDNSRNQHVSYDNNMLNCSNDLLNNKSPFNYLNDTLSQKENNQDAYYWNHEKCKNSISNYSTTEKSKLKPREKVNANLSKQKENYSEYSEEESEENSKKRLSTKYKKHSRAKENTQKNDIYESYRKNNDKKSKQKTHRFKKNNFLKNDIDNGFNLSNEMYCNKNKKKYNKNYSRKSSDSTKDQLLSDYKGNHTLRNNKSHKINSQNNMSLGFYNTVYPKFKEPQYVNVKTPNNMIANKPMIQQSSEIQQNQIYNTENSDNKQSYIQNEVTHIQGTLPINIIKTGEETHIPSIQVYSPVVQTNVHEEQSITHNMHTQIPQQQEINKLQNQLPLIQSELTHIQEHMPQQEIHKLQNQLPSIQSELTYIQENIPQCESMTYQPNSLLSNIRTNVTQTHVMPQVKTQVPYIQSQISQIQNQVLQMPTEISHMQNQMPQKQCSMHQIQTQVPQMQNTIHQVQTQVPQSQNQILQFQNEIPQSEIINPQMQTQNLHIQNRLPQLQSQVPLMQKSIFLEQMQLSQVHTNEKIKSPYNMCNLIELPKQCVEHTNYNNNYGLCNVQKQGECNLDNCFIKSLNPNNTPYNRVMRSVNDLENKQYIQNDSVNSLTKFNKNLYGANMNNAKEKCVEQVKTVDSTINFFKSENEIPWLKSYIDMQHTPIKDKVSNMSYINVDFNNGKQNVNYNVHNPAEILANHSNCQLFNDNIYNPNNSLLEINKNNNNHIDISKIIKISNENLMNLQNKQLLNILHEESNGKSIASQNVVYQGINNFNIKETNNINGNSKNSLDNTNKHISCMNYANSRNFSQEFVNKTNNIIIPSIPNEIINKNQFVQNNIKKTEYLN
ncbi:conserved Plasmodium protein, unknown function [Plasmodium gallinaceum]|uniref:Uncharacterized protein n=1 Tax=Plasmodium gallinaceum TaxID=5849 RepID=A0A1J1GV47_PLAGA|nr:conserved Plasmodium protein, unknown function [Plasmodium gallinaceum]CRG94914.1 conserved Plasmodium protein, unknown function [Plasmodium gallinaceum]